jgi:hypothetical protein
MGEEFGNLTQDDVLDLITDFPVQPLKNKLIITINRKMEDDGISLTNVGMDEVQFVIAKGPHVLDLDAGQKVILDLEKMIQRVEAKDNSHETVGMIKIRPIQVGERVFGLISDAFVDAKDCRD